MRAIRYPLTSREVPETIRKDRTNVADIMALLAGKVEDSLAATIETALIAQQKAVSLDAIAEALQTGNVGKVLMLLDLPAVLAPMSLVKDALQDAVYGAGAAAALTINLQLRGSGFVFNRLNPRLLQWLEQYSLGLIREIGEGTKEGVRQVLRQGMQAGQNPKTVARQVKQIVGLTNRQAAAVGAYRKELQGFHLRKTAAGYNLGGKIDRVNGTQVLRPDAAGLPKDKVYERRLRDFRYDSQLSAAMASGKPIPQAKIEQMVAAYQRKYLAYRARTIARTEAIRANNVGVQDAWVQAIDTGIATEDLVRKRWFVARDERLCEICAPIPGLNPKRGVKLSQVFTTPDGPRSLPPAHPNCRCTVVIRQGEPEQLA